MKGYTYLSSCRLASGGKKWLKIVLNDCFDRGTLVGIQIYKHMIKCINDFYEYVKNIEQNAETMTEYTYEGRSESSNTCLIIHIIFLVKQKKTYLF